MSKKTLQQTAYELIRERIIRCEFPPGSFLNTLELQEQFGFSRTPIREALGRLETENLVNFFPNKGYTVSDVSLSIIHTTYEIRLLIEPYIVLHYGAHVDTEALQKMRSLFQADFIEAENTQGNQASAEYMAHDDELHALLRSGCPNIYLVQVLEQISAQTQRVRIISGYAGSKLKKLCQEHIEIIDALLEEKYAAASKLMTSHLIRARKNAFKAPSLK